jgi:hypothetical protein
MCATLEQMRAACGAGDVAAVVDLRSRGCPWNVTCILEAAEKGHVPILDYLHTHGCPHDSDKGWICTLAASGGHLDALTFLHTHGYPWTAEASAFATLMEHVECRRYLNAHGCPRECPIEPIPIGERTRCTWGYGHCDRAEYQNPDYNYDSDGPGFMCWEHICPCQSKHLRSPATYMCRFCLETVCDACYHGCECEDEV